MTDKYIGIGEQDFKKIILENIYYIDKTEYIKEIIDDKSSAILITRPRRFGKTLNMSTLKYYFDINTKEYDRKLFDGLKIMKCGEKYTNEMYKYPVINITFAGAKASSIEELKLVVKGIIADLYLEFKYILKSDKIDESEKNMYNDIVNYRADDVVIQNSILRLSRYLEKYYEKKVIVLIDEYDAPITSAYSEGFYDEAVKFMRGMYLQTLKTNPHLEKAVVTRSIKNIKRKYI